MNLTSEQQKTFETLQQPTMNLIGSYYEMSAEIKSLFIFLIASYEANPTPQTAKMLSDLVNSRESIAVKKARIRSYGAKAPKEIRLQVKKKYLDEKQSVPSGVPTSGMLMVALGIISKADKDLLMDIQAASRLLSDTLNPQRNSDVEKTKEDYSAVSNKPFATKMQRLEDIVHATIDYSFMEAKAFVNDLNPTDDINNTKDAGIRSMAYWFLSDSTFIQKANAEALLTLKNSAEKIGNTKLSAEALSLCSALSSEISEERLTIQDYQQHQKNTEGSVIGDLVARNSKQIMLSEITTVRCLSQNKTR